jgi:hypothetical protein
MSEGRAVETFYTRVLDDLNHFLIAVKGESRMQTLRRPLFYDSGSGDSCCNAQSAEGRHLQINGQLLVWS